MTARQDITTAALLGTERQPFTPPAAPGEMGALLARLPADSEVALLGAAAAVALFRQAGALPPIIDTPAPAACPPETIPVCGPRVADGVALMLGGKHREALPEMLTALAAVGRRVPALLLPDLLKQGRQSKDLRGAILPVLGNRGRWLAAQNREWAWADQLILETAETLEQVWTEGGSEARLSALTRLRQADPARGLALLQSTWTAEPSANRVAFVAALEAGLSQADEPFLEAALDDRGKDVRRAAAACLARMPDSAFARRMIARVQPLLVAKSTLLGKFSLEVTLPNDYDKGMERDGIAEKSPDKVMGDKAGWLCQIIGVIPLGYWTQTWRRKPEEITEAADKTEWSSLLRRGWELAVRRWPDADWLLALLYGGPGQTVQTDLYRRQQALQPALAEIPATGLDRLILEQLRPKANLFGKDAPVPLHDQHPALPLLQSHTKPWSAELSRAVIASLRQRIVQGMKGDQTAWHSLRLLPVFACRVPPALSQEMAAGWPYLSEVQRHWEAPIHEFVTTLQFRHDLLHEISKENRP